MSAPKMRPRIYAYTLLLSYLASLVIGGYYQVAFATHPQLVFVIPSMYVAVLLTGWAVSTIVNRPGFSAAAAVANHQPARTLPFFSLTSRDDTRALPLLTALVMLQAAAAPGFALRMHTAVQ